ncbi:DUF937 domain-containing protein [Hymenobacter rubidus]|uniref:DUF937 domain-containing protein n=1 Tax=Hymenobacter rubidus TaxID=1441626 RepID=UPI00191CF8F0|nr:DUF937 domain-containing protein [Hymenobacter rubidus]
MLQLLNAIQNAFSQELTIHLAARLGEGEAGIRKALGGIVPLVLCGLINKTVSGEAEAVYDLSQRAFQMANGPVGSIGGVLAMLGNGTVSGEALRQGESLLASLFGTVGSIAAEPVSRYAGIRTDTATTLLRVVGAVLPALVGQYAYRQSLDSDKIAALLLRLKAPVRNMLPQGLRGLTGLVWLGGLGASAPRPATACAYLPGPAASQPARSATFGAYWGRILLLLVGVAMLVYLLLSGTPTGPVLTAGHAMPKSGTVEKGTPNNGNAL